MLGRFDLALEYIDLGRQAPILQLSAALRLGERSFELVPRRRDGCVRQAARSASAQGLWRRSPLTQHPRPRQADFSPLTFSAAEHRASASLGTILPPIQASATAASRCRTHCSTSARPTRSRRPSAQLRIELFQQGRGLAAASSPRTEASPAARLSRAVATRLSASLSEPSRSASAGAGSLRSAASASPLVARARNSSASRRTRAHLVAEALRGSLVLVVVVRACRARRRRS